ncbi:MAG: hypothetical protein ACREL3_07725 [Gemmatimonadales bacterium]
MAAGVGGVRKRAVEHTELRRTMSGARIAALMLVPLMLVPLMLVALVLVALVLGGRHPRGHAGHRDRPQKNGRRQTAGEQLERKPTPATRHQSPNCFR